MTPDGGGCPWRFIVKNPNAEISEEEILKLQKENLAVRINA
jgi:hypothetical protein